MQLHPVALTTSLGTPGPTISTRHSTGTPFAWYSSRRRPALVRYPLTPLQLETRFGRQLFGTSIGRGFGAPKGLMRAPSLVGDCGDNRSLRASPKELTIALSRHIARGPALVRVLSPGNAPR